jgi:hypothetical protein
MDWCKIVESLIEGRIVKEKDQRAVFHLVLGLDYQLDKIHYRVRWRDALNEMLLCQRNWRFVFKEICRFQYGGWLALPASAILNALKLRHNNLALADPSACQVLSEGYQGRIKMMSQRILSRTGSRSICSLHPSYDGSMSVFTSIVSIGTSD